MVHYGFKLLSSRPFLSQYVLVLQRIVEKGCLKFTFLSLYKLTPALLKIRGVGHFSKTGGGRGNPPIPLPRIDPAF